MLSRIPLGDSDWLTLEFTPPSGEEPCWVVFLHGLAAHRGGDKALYLHEELSCRGYGFARFDFRGHGGSSGAMEELTLSRQMEDLDAVLSWLRSEHRAQDVVLIGSSLGGLTAAWYCARHPDSVRGQLLIAPAFGVLERTLEALGESGHDRWRAEGKRRFDGDFDSFELGYQIVEEGRELSWRELSTSTVTPTWIAHGANDEVVPLDASLHFVEQCPSPPPVLRVIANGDHRLARHHEALRDIALECLDQVSERKGNARQPARRAHRRGPRQDPVLS